MILTDNFSQSKYYKSWTTPIRTHVGLFTSRNVDPLRLLSEVVKIRDNVALQCAIVAG